MVAGDHDDSDAGGDTTRNGVRHFRAGRVLDADDAEELETITVVGSRIKRTDIETSQPVFVIEREDLQRTGLATIGDIYGVVVPTAADVS